MRKLAIVLVFCVLIPGCAQNEQIQNTNQPEEIQEPTLYVEETYLPEETEQSQSTELEDIETSNEKNIYLHMEAPTDTAELFLEGIVSTANFEHSPLTIVDENTIIWSRFDFAISDNPICDIMISTYDGEQWGDAQYVEWSNENSENSSFYYDGQILLHLKGDPYQLASYDLEDKVQTIIDISTDASLLHPTKHDNTLIYNMYVEGSPESILVYSEYDNGYSEPMKLLSDKDNEYLNITPFINADGTILLYGSVFRPDGKGASDLYVSFKGPDGEWSEGINLGDVNTENNERFPSLSPDGKYLFFVSNRTVYDNIASDTLPQNGLGDIYWIDASFIYDLNPYK